MTQEISSAASGESNINKAHVIMTDAYCYIIGGEENWFQRWRAAAAPMGVSIDGPKPCGAGVPVILRARLREMEKRRRVRQIDFNMWHGWCKA